MAAALPASRRDALGRFLRHLARGERIAERTARRQVALAPDARARRFLAAQARQESMHAVVLGAAAAADPVLRHFALTPAAIAAERDARPSGAPAP